MLKVSYIRPEGAPKNWIVSFKHTPKAPPTSAVTLVARISTYKFGGGHKHSDDSTGDMVDLSK